MHQNFQWTPRTAASCWGPGPAKDILKGGWKGMPKGLKGCKGKGLSKGGSNRLTNPLSQRLAEPQVPAASDDGVCKFFGSAKGCDSARCPFSHANPNSVKPCQFKQQAGNCDKGDACTYRHQPWESADQAIAHYATRESGHTEKAVQRYKELHRGGGEHPENVKLKAEHVEGVVERELQVETYGEAAVRMMEKMGYKAGSGLGKNLQGKIKLAKPCQALEQASQNCALGFGHFGAAGSSSVAERAARLAAARAMKRQRIEQEAFFQHVLEDVTSSDDEKAPEQAVDRSLVDELEDRRTGLGGSQMP